MAEFEISLSEIIWRNGLKVQRVYIDHMRPYERFVTVREGTNPLINDGATFVAIETDGLHAPADIPALIAALTRAREIADGWAAEAEGGAP